MLIIAVAFGTQSGNRTLEGVAKATDAVAEVSLAAGNLAGATANATVAVTGVAVEAIVVATSAADEAYRGVDVLDLQAQRTTCKAIGNSPANLSLWVLGGADGAVSGAVSQPISSLVRSLTRGVPAKEVSSEKFDVHGNFWQFCARAKLRTDGSAAVAAWVVNASFTTQWTNPFWHGWGFRIDAESARIIDRMKKSLVKLGPVPSSLFVLDDATLLEELGIGLFILPDLPPRTSFRWVCFTVCLFGMVIAIWQRHRVFSLSSRLVQMSWWQKLAAATNAGAAHTVPGSDTAPAEPDGTGGSPLQVTTNYIGGGLDMEGQSA